MAPISSGFTRCGFGLCVLARLPPAPNSPPIQNAILVAFASLSLVLASSKCLTTCLLQSGFTGQRYSPGDSISSGIRDRERCGRSSWAYHGLESGQPPRAGATWKPPPGSGRALGNQPVILLEIGGNDLLGRTDSRTYYVQLDRLLDELVGRQPVVIELPLLLSAMDSQGAKIWPGNMDHLIPKRLLGLCSAEGRHFGRTPSV